MSRVFTDFCLAIMIFFQVGLKEVEDILRDVDLNGDGLVDFEGKITFIFLLPSEKGNTVFACMCVVCLTLEN